MMYYDETTEWTEEDMRQVEEFIAEHPMEFPEDVLQIASTPGGKNLFATILHRIKEEEE